MELLGGKVGFVAYETRYWFPSTESRSNSPFYYSYETGPLHVVMLGCYVEYLKDSKQAQWLRQDLAAVNRERTPWVIVGMHVRLSSSLGFLCSSSWAIELHNRVWTIASAAALNKLSKSLPRSRNSKHGISSQFMARSVSPSFPATTELYLYKVPFDSWSAILKQNFWDCLTSIFEIRAGSFPLAMPVKKRDAQREPNRASTMIRLKTISLIGTAGSHWLC